jgi:hypothetical protein
MAKPLGCARCGRENDPSFAFCLDCGQALRAAPEAPPPLSQACAGCGTLLQPGFRFCAHCGAPAGGAPPPPRTPAPQHTPIPPRTPAAGPGPHGASQHLAPPPLPGSVRIAAVRNDGHGGAVHALEREETLCGRTEGVIRLGDDPTVSPRHARFTLRRGVLAVEDLGSVNGTFLRIREPRRLAPGAELRVGRQLLRIEPLTRPVLPADGVRAWGGRDPGCRYRLAQLLDGGGPGEVFPLRDGENAIGREAGEVVFPSDRFVSARHARLDVTTEAITLVDLGSSNGTFVKIAGAIELAPGDQLLVGAQLLRVEA